MSELKRLNVAASVPNLKLSVEEQQPDIKDPMQQRREVLFVFSDIVNNFKLFFQDMIANGFDAKRLLTQENNDISTVAGLNNYQTESLVFNTRYQYHPFAIAMCHSTSEVAKVYKTAVKYNLPVRVRSGGHDHAGESSGDNTILIDLTGIKPKVKIRNDIATIGAGYRFYQLTPELAKKNRMIPHGTCATVGLSGFIQGGGWGPWTRKHGMCCEHLVGATVVLGDGTVIKASENNHPEILWALRGGGGMSYGVVTEWKVRTFKLPKEIRRFTIEWNTPNDEITICGCPTPSKKYPTIDVLSVWENVINSKDTAALLGTNLKINAISYDGDVNEGNITDFFHHCLMYGYWEGTEKDLLKFIDKFFKTVGGTKQAKVVVYPPNGSGQKHPDDKYPTDLMGDWGRNSLADVSAYSGFGLGKTALLEGTPFTPDYDAPAPHKISSKLVPGLDAQTWTRQSKIQMIATLSSNMLSTENEQLGLFSYVTLGAIVGEFYQNMGVTQTGNDKFVSIWDKQEDDENGNKKLGVAFPYRPCQYTLQYQTWWNESIKNKIELQQNKVWVDTNRAMDWIDISQSTHIDGAYGAFISFKDPGIATEVYFQQNYDELVEIKKTYVEDKYNHLRTRKTII